MTAHAETRKNSAAPFARAIVAVAAFLVHQAGKVAQGMRNRRAAALLAGLDDRMLSDIGLTRGDLRDAFSEPPWRDPTAVLVGRAEERRQARPNVCRTVSPRVAPSLVPDYEVFCRPPTGRPSYQTI